MYSFFDTKINANNGDMGVRAGCCEYITFGYNRLMAVNREQRRVNYILALLAVLLVAGAVYSYVRFNQLSARIDILAVAINATNQNLASTTAELQSTIADTHSSLSKALTDEQQNVGTIKQQLQNQVGTLSGTLTNLQKLQQLDPELLKKYSKVYFLNDNYVPAHLTEIPLTYDYSDTKKLLFYTNALPHLQALMDAASSTGVKLYVDSAYRSFAEQKALKGIYSVTYGAGTANSFSADQGYSEHQLGTALDFITTGLGGALDGFDQTAAYTWLLANAYKYGFIISYPKDNGYYVFEPWHWRFVGVKLATDLHKDGKNFYDVDQRTIDTYLVNIFD